MCTHPHAEVNNFCMTESGSHQEDHGTPVVMAMQFQGLVLGQPLPASQHLALDSYDVTTLALMMLKSEM